MPRIIVPCLASLLYTFIALPAAGEEPPPESSLWLGGGADSADTRDWSADLTLATGRHHTLALGAGQMSIIDNGREVIADQWHIGVGTRHLAPLSIDLRYSFWGNDQEMSTRSARLALDWALGRWTLGLSPEHRRFTGYTRPILLLGGLRREFEFTSNGLGASATVRPDERWQLRLSAVTYDYSRDPRGLGAPLASQIFSWQTLALSSGLWEKTATAEVSRRFDAAGARLYRSSAESAIDGSRSDTTGAVLAYPAADSVTIELEAGVVSGSSTDTRFGRVALGYFW